MEPLETPPSKAPRNRGRLNSTIVATGAALALTLAGLGIAGAQTGSSSTSDTTASPAGAQAETPGGPKGDKPAGAARHHDPGKRRHRGVKIGLVTAAKTIGISEGELKTALRSGQSIADVARFKNVDVQKVIDALVAEARKTLAEKVAAGQLTQAQADQKSATMVEHITAFVNHAGPGPRPGGEHRRGFRAGPPE